MKYLNTKKENGPTAQGDCQDEVVVALVSIADDCLNVQDLAALLLERLHQRNHDDHLAMLVDALDPAEALIESADGLVRQAVDHLAEKHHRMPGVLGNGSGAVQVRNGPSHVLRDADGHQIRLRSVGVVVELCEVRLCVQLPTHRTSAAAGQGRAGQGRAGQYRALPGRARQGGAGRGGKGQNRGKEDRTGQGGQGAQGCRT